MGKKGTSLPIIYLVGMLLVAIGFCVPMFRLSLGALGAKTANGFKFIDFDKVTFVDIGALLIFIGAVAGVVFSFVGGKSASLLKLVCVIVSIVGGIVLIIGFNQDSLYKMIGKQFFKHAYIGFYMILAGWVVGLLGSITNK